MNTGAEIQGLEVEIAVGSTPLKGSLALATNASGVVLFVHGSGSSRFSSRNQAVARDLQSGGLSTLLFDLLSEDEERVDEITGELRFDIGLLSDRVIAVTGWLRQEPDTRDLGIGYFGARWCGRWCLEAAVPIWPWSPCRWWPRPRCSSWAATTSPCSR
jgi:putative phosphoribosyl transferase